MRFVYYTDLPIIVGLKEPEVVIESEEDGGFFFMSEAEYDALAKKFGLKEKPVIWDNSKNINFKTEPLEAVKE